jgi:hypothetical protein
MSRIRSSHDPRYDEGKRREAAELYESGLSVREVAERMEVSVRRAWEFLDDAGVEMRPAGRPKTEKGE